MGRKRKTRWRRLSIGGNSGNEEEEAERESEILGFSKMNPASRHRSGSQPSIINSYSTFDQSSPSPVPVMNGSGKYVPNSGVQSPGDPKSSDESSSGNGGVNGYSSQREGHGPSYHHHHHNGRGDHHQAYNNGYVHQPHHYAQYNGKEHRGNGEGSYQSSNGYHSQSDGSGSGYYPSSNYYHHRNSYNQAYRGSQYERGGGYRGRGGDYHHSSRFGGRFRKPRPYASNYYYNNGTSNHQSSDDAGTNRPSYNQEEYTKITTPRQDVLFKKGYLSQRKPVTQSTSVDSTSGPTTPSTNGTPDTHSTNGINSDYSEGYENGETDCGGLPYDDTVYYGPPPETAVFTDPNTGQVYYGQSNGEYFDAYPVSPVMMGGYPTPVYYHLPYPGLDWNGLPTPIYPIVPLGPPPPLDDHHSPSQIQSGESHYLANGQKYESGGGGKGTMIGIDGTSTDFGSLPESKDGRRSESSSTTPLTNGTLKNSKGTEKGIKKTSTGKGGTKGSNGTLSDSSSSSREGSTSTLSSAASTPLSPPVVNGASGLGSLVTSMSTLALGEPLGHHHHLHQHLPPLHQGIPQPMPMSHYLTHTVPPPSHHHPPPILYHPHPAFVYAPPIYNGVVVPIAPAASTAESQGSPNSRKKRKLRRRKKDDGQLTDESSSEESTISAEEPKDQVPLPPIQSPSKTLPVLISPSPSSLPVSNTSSKLTTPETSPTKSNSHAKKKNIGEDVIRPETPTEEQLGPDRKSSSGNKIESSQIPLEGDEVIKPEEETSSGETVTTTNPKEESKESVVEVEAEAKIQVQVHLHLHSSKKPKALTLNSDLETNTITSGGLERGDVSLLLPLKSPDTLEPSSPDSFNTTQSVAGSEVPSVSISETDFMNRTTSVDEVEEDLPPEELFIESISTPPEIQLLRTHHPQGEYEVESETSRSSEITQPCSSITNESHPSETIHVSSAKEIPLHDSSESSPIGSPQNVTSTTAKHSPSPETIFERSLELPVLPALNVETLESLPIETLEPTEIFSNELCDLVETLTVQEEELREYPSVTTTAPLSPASDDVQCIQINEPILTLLGKNTTTEVPLSPGSDDVQCVQIKEPTLILLLGENTTTEVPLSPASNDVQCIQINEPTLTLLNENKTTEKPPQSPVTSSPIQRPQSITLAVSEWLKIQGNDVFTPVNQLQELFNNEDYSGTDDDEEDLTAEEITKLDATDENVKSTSRTSNCVIQ